MSKSEIQKKRSPLKENPLRSPGESIQKEIEQLISDQLLPVVLTTILLFFLATYEWWRWFASAPPQPVPLMLAACSFLAYAIYHIVRIRPRLRSLRLGRDGERIVGQLLEESRINGFHVFHDIPGEGFNIDHVIVAPQGVFAVETKTFSKPSKGEAKVVQKGDQIFINGLEPDRNPIVQARAIRNWLDDLLFHTTGKHYPVRGVVVFPGWWVEPSAKKEKNDIWILNPKALSSFILHEPDVLKKEDMALISHRLTNYVTSF